MIKSFSKEEIIELTQDVDKFKESIISSKGFLLYLTNKYDIVLTPELLIGSISEYSIRFVVEHMKNNKYTVEQSAIVIDYLKEESDNQNNSVNMMDYDLNSLLTDLKNNDDLPKGFRSVVKISFNDFLENSDVLASLITRNQNSMWSSDGFEITEPLLEPLFKNISKEDFLKIDETILGKYPSLFFMSQHLLAEDDIKSLFNKSLNYYYSLKNQKSGGYKVKLRDYGLYPFAADEKDLFLSLLKNDYTRDYKRTRQYNGFDLFFTKNEYILNYNISGIRYLSKKEILDNETEIRKGFMAAYLTSNYKRMGKIYDLDIDEESLKFLFTKEYIKELLVLSDGFYFDYFDRDNNRKTNAMNYIHKSVYKLCAEDDDMLNLIGLQNIINNVTSLYEHNRKYFDDDYVSSTQVILNKFNKAINTENLFKNLNKDKLGCYLEVDIPKLIVEGMQGKETVNYLFALMTIVNIGKQPWKIGIYAEEIKRVIPLLNKDDVKKIAKIANYKIEKISFKNNPKQDYENNFSNFTPEIIKSMDFTTITELFSISEDFRKMIVNDKLYDIIINEKLKNVVIDEELKKLNHRTNNHNDFIPTVLRLINDKKSPYYQFAKDFIKDNREFMLKYYFSDLITHPMREQLIKINTKELEIDSYKKIESIISEYSEKNIYDSRLYIIRSLDTISKKDKIKFSEESEKISDEKDILLTEINRNLRNISFGFYENKIKSLDMIGAIQLYNVNPLGFRDLILDKVQSLDFKTTKMLLSNQEFLHFIYENKKSDSDNNDRKVPLYLNPSFTEKQNTEIVELLLINLNNKDLFMHKYENDVNLGKILYLIEPKQRVKISNALVVKHDPKEMFNSYDFLPGETGYFKKHVEKQFSVDEIMVAINNLNSQGKKIICQTDSNITHDKLIVANYEYNEDDGKNPNLNSYLNLLKKLEDDPINYLACVSSNSIKNFITRDKDEDIDLAKSKFYNEYININVVIRAMKEIFTIYSEAIEKEEAYTENGTYKGISLKNGVKAVSNFIAYTYSSNRDEINSNFDEDKSKEILKTIIEYAPNLFFNTSTIGKLGSTDKELSENFSEYYYPNMIDDFLLNSNKSDISETNYSYDKRKEYWQSTSADKFLHNLIAYLTQEKDISGLHKLDFVIKEQEFNNERPWGKKLNEFSTPLSEFLSNFEYKKEIEKSLLFLDLMYSTKDTEKGGKRRSKI